MITDQITEIEERKSLLQNNDRTKFKIISLVFPVNIAIILGFFLYFLIQSCLYPVSVQFNFQVRPFLELNIPLAVLFSVVLAVLLVILIKTKNLPDLKLSLIVSLPSLLLSSLSLVYIFIFATRQPQLTWGPLFQPHENGTLISYYTDNPTSNQIKINNTSIKSSKNFTNFHSHIVNQLNFSLFLFGKQYKYSTPSNISRFVVTADIHNSSFYSMRSVSNQYNKNDFQMQIIAGDLTNNGTNQQLALTLSCTSQKSLILNVGNHDTRGDALIDNVLQREYNYYQVVGNIGIFSVFVFKDGKGQEDLNESRIDEAIQMIKKYENDTTQHQFVVIHYPIYSTGEYGSNPYLAHAFETYLDSHQWTKIRAVFAGHDHIFSSFLRGKTYVFVSASGGGNIDNMTSAKEGIKQWPSTEMHGPLIGDINTKMGYQYHLDSYMRYTRTDVSINQSETTYSVVDLNSQNIIKEYVQKLQKFEFGPLFVPKESGTMVAWYARYRYTVVRIKELDSLENGWTDISLTNSSSSFEGDFDEEYNSENHSNKLSKKQNGGKNIPINTVQPPELHTVFVPSQNFLFQIPGLQTVYNFTTPKKLHKFAVSADIHAHKFYSQQIGDDFQAHVLAGDYQNEGFSFEFAMTFNKFHTKPIVMAMGNHDTKGKALARFIIDRNFTYYQKIGDAGFVSCYVFRDLWGDENVTESRVDQCMQVLREHENDTDVAHQFFVMHHPMYSTGFYGSFPYLTRALEDYFDSNPNSKIRAVFTGHDHIFSAFKRKNIMIFVNSCGGGQLDIMTKEKYGDKRWSAASLHGPLVGDNQSKMGFEYHLDSWSMLTRTDVVIGDGQIQYSVTDLDSGKVVKVYNQNLS